MIVEHKSAIRNQMETAWQEFRKRTIHESARDDVLYEMKVIFMSGALAVLNEISLSSENSTGENRIAACFDSLKHEVFNFHRREAVLKI